MSKLSPEALALLREARSLEPPASAAQCRQVLRAVRAAAVLPVPIASATLAGSAAAQAGTSSGAAMGAAHAVGSSSLTKLLAWVAVGASVAAGTVGVGALLQASDTQNAPRATPSARARPQQPAVSSEARTPRPPLIPAPNQVATQAKQQAKVHPVPTGKTPALTTNPPTSSPEWAIQQGSSSTGPGVPAPRSAPGDDPRLEEELRLLARVQAQLRAGNGQQALELLDRQGERLHGNEQLADERLAAEVFAACATNEVARARRAAAEFLRRAPGSPLAPRVRSSCGAQPQ